MIEPVIVSGCGLITCLGLTAEETWSNVVRGRCGIGPMSALEQSPAGGDKPGGNGGQAVDLPEDWMNGKPREVRYLRRAIEDALCQAAAADAWSRTPSCVACVMGTTLHGMRQGGAFLRTQDYSHLCGFLASHTLEQALAGLPVGGLTTTNCSACSSGLGAIALGVTLLRSGQADVVIAGGYDPVSEYAYAGFDSMRLVAPGALKPFCLGREGMKLAEGYAVVILERASDAKRRGVQAFAEIRGIGESADAHHLTQPHPEGEGALRAIEQALQAAQLRPDQVGLIAAHATATPNNDASEFAAFSRAFGDSLPSIPAVAFKSHLGHTLGAAGGAELILSMLAMKHQTAPATANVAATELEFPRLSISNAPRDSTIDATLNTSLGFGGANTCVVLSRAAAGIAARSVPQRDVFITGVGFLAPGMVGNDAFAARLKATNSTSPPRTGALAEDEYAHLINARRVRRMSEYSKLTLAATAVAMQHAGISDVAAFAESCSAILGTTHGSASFCNDYYRQIVDQGMGAANPVLFAEGVPNAASAQLSLMLGIKGGCQTVIGSRTAGLDALSLACQRIALGDWDRAIVGAAEEDIDILNAAYRHAGLRSSDAGGTPFENQLGFLTSAGAVSLIIESRSSIERRGGGTPLARVARTSAARCDLRVNGAETIATGLSHLARGMPVASSACATWLDEVERRGLERLSASHGSPHPISALYGITTELFSVGPLASIAGGILTRSLPVAHPARSIVPVSTWAALVTDLSGLVATTTIELVP